MSYLVAAIEAEARGDFKGAAENYRHITDAGSPLDRVGIHQALARCLEKQGDVKGAAEWRRKAGMGYLALPDDVMPVDQREYLALVEYRNAVQDVSADVTAARGLAREYGEVLAKNFSEGAKGLTHEGLFAGAFFRALGDHRTPGPLTPGPGPLTLTTDSGTAYRIRQRAMEFAPQFAAPGS